MTPDDELRTRAALMAMQGLLSAIYDYSPARMLDFERIAADAVDAADALLEQLKRPTAQPDERRT